MRLIKKVYKEHYQSHISWVLYVSLRYEFELTKAAYRLLQDMAKVKPGESVLITVDSAGDLKLAMEVAKVAEALGAKVMVAWHSTPKGYGAIAVPYLPEPLVVAADKTDVWIEFNVQWLLYSPMWDRAVTNGRTRQIMLGGLDVEKFVRLIGNINYEAQKAFQDKLVELTRRARKVRIKCAGGTDISFENDPKRPITNEIDYSTPGAHFVPGQIGWAPKEETVNGKIVFDASLSGGEPLEYAPLPEPVTFVLEKGRIVRFEGGRIAKITEEYFKSLNDPNMYLIAHVCYGVHPYAKLGPATVENERIWGAINFGFGHQGPMYSGGKPREAKSHVDGVCLNCSVWLDDVQVWDNGRVVHPELKELAKKLGKE